MSTKLDIRKLGSIAICVLAGVVCICALIYEIPTMFGLSINNQAVAYSVPVVGTLIRFVQTSAGIFTSAFVLTALVGAKVMIEMWDKEHSEFEMNMNCDVETKILEKITSFHGRYLKKTFMWKKKIINRVKYFSNTEFSNKKKSIVTMKSEI